MPLSSPMTRWVRNGLLFTAAGTAAVALTFAVAPVGPAGSPTAAAVAGHTEDLPAHGPTGKASAPARTEAAAARAAAAKAAAKAAARAAAARASHAKSAGSAAQSHAGSSSSSAPSPAGGDGAGTGLGGHSETRRADGMMLIGATQGGLGQAVAGTGVQLANHAYATFASKVPQAAMITVGAANTPWRQVAAASPGSGLYSQIVTWAQTIKARGATVMVAYNHEPEVHDRLTLGSSADFIAAYRHVESIFDQQGASNVVWTWQMSAYAFRTNPSNEQYAPKWYPGDDFVDDVGGDAYNWASCRGPGSYTELETAGAGVLAFARAHGKTASFPEFGSDANPNRAQWLANARQYFVQNGDVIAAAFYFNRPPPEKGHDACNWALTSASEYSALRSMAQDTAHFAV